MIEEGIKNGTYSEIDVITIQDLKRLQDFFAQKL